MTSRFKLLLATTILIQAISVQASAERTVLNGGGLAEMQAIHLHTRLAEYLAPCLMKENPCGLDEQQVLVLPSVLEAAKLARPEKLLINTELAPEILFQLEAKAGGEIQLSSQALYHGSKPKSFSEIAAVLLAAFWSQVERAGQNRLYSNALKITTCLQGERVDFRVLSKPLIVLHQQTIRLGPVSRNLLFLEDELKTVSVNGVFEDAFAIENWRTVDQSLVADVTFQTNSHLNFQTLVLNYKLDKKGLIDESYIQTSLHDAL